MTETDLRANLRDLADLFERYGVGFWAQTMRKKSEFIVADCELLRSLKSMFGGMGSLTDCYITPENGHRVTRDEQRSVNEKLDQLTTQLYLTIKQLKTDFGCDGF